MISAESNPSQICLYSRTGSHPKVACSCFVSVYRNIRQIFDLHNRVTPFVSNKLRTSCEHLVQCTSTSSTTQNGRWKSSMEMCVEYKGCRLLKQVVFTKMHHQNHSSLWSDYYLFKRGHAWHNRCPSATMGRLARSRGYNHSEWSN